MEFKEMMNSSNEKWHNVREFLGICYSIDSSLLDLGNCQLASQLSGVNV